MLCRTLSLESFGVKLLTFFIAGRSSDLVLLYLRVLLSGAVTCRCAFSSRGYCCLVVLWTSFVCGFHPAFVPHLLLIWLCCIFLGCSLLCCFWLRGFLLLYLQHSCVGVFIFLMVQCDSYSFLVFRCVGSLILKLSYVLWRRPDSVGVAGAVVRLVGSRLL